MRVLSHTLGRAALPQPLALRRRRMVTEGPDGVSVGEEVVLYESGAAAEAAIGNSLTAPPQLERLREWVTAERVPRFPPQFVENPPSILRAVVRYPDHASGEAVEHEGRANDHPEAN